MGKFCFYGIRTGGGKVATKPRSWVMQRWSGGPFHLPAGIGYQSLSKGREGKEEGKQKSHWGGGNFRSVGATDMA